MTLRLVSLATVPELSIAAMKGHARVSHSEDDALISDDLQSAIEQVERASGVGFFGATWEWFGNAFPADGVETGIGPITSVEWVRYLDADAAEQTLDAAAYRADAVSTRGLIFAVDEWPTTAEQENAVKVRFVAGDGTVPAPINRAVRMMVADAYDNRTEGGELSGPAQRMVGMYRRVWF